MRSTVDRYPWSSLYRHLINSRCRSTLDLLGWHLHCNQYSNINILVDSQSRVNLFSQTGTLSVVWYIWVSQLHSHNCQMSSDEDVDWESTKYWSRCWISVDWGSIEGINRHLAMRIHDPRNVYLISDSEIIPAWSSSHTRIHPYPTGMQLLLESSGIMCPTCVIAFLVSQIFNNFSLKWV